MRYTQPQSGPLQIDRDNPITWRLRFVLNGADPGRSSFGPKVTQTGLTSTVFNAKGRAQSFNGTNQALSAQLDLTNTQIVTVVALVNLSAYAGTQQILWEQGTDTVGTQEGFDAYMSSGGLEVWTGTNLTGRDGNTYSPPSPGLHLLVAVYDHTKPGGSQVSLWVDGVLLSRIGQGGNNGVTGSFFPNKTLYISARTASSSWATQQLNAFYVYDRLLATSEIQSITANPWQIFKAPVRRLWSATTGGAQSYSYSASGGVQFSGAALGMRTATKTAAGGVLFSGAATRTKGVAKTPSGGLLLSGASTTLRARAIAAIGGLSLSGAAGLLRGASRASLGGLKMAGAATVTFFSAIQTRIVNPVGGILLGGAASVARAARKASSGGFILSGASAVTSGAAGRFRALILVAGILRVIPTAQLGTGKKPIVYIAQRLRERLAAEGTPVILVNGRLRQLQPGETLDI